MTTIYFSNPSASLVNNQTGFVKKTTIIFLSALAMLFFGSMKVNAAAKYWIAATASAAWTSTSSWATSSGGASGAPIPVSGADSVIFDANSMAANGGSAITATAVPAITLQKLAINGTATNVTLLAATTGNTISINGTTGTATDTIASGCNLALGVSGTALNLTIITTASQRFGIGGTLNLINGTLSATAATTLVNVYSGGAIFLNGGTISTANTTTTVNGAVVNNSGTITSATAATLVFASGGVYTHARDGGSIPASVTTAPLCTWSAGSICRVTGLVSTAFTSFSGTFANLYWNNAGQTSATGAIIAAVTVTNFIDSAGTFTLPGFAFTCTNSTVLGTVNVTSATGTKAFGTTIINNGGAINMTAGATVTSNALTINNDGTWSWATTLGAVTVTGDFTNNGTFTNSVNTTYSISGNIFVNSGATFISGAGTYTMTGTSKAITGTVGSVTFGGNLAIGTTDTLDINSVTVTGVLSGASLIMGGQGNSQSGGPIATGDTLKLGGSPTLTTLTCTVNTPNTVSYIGNTNTQTVKSFTYNNLDINTTGRAAQVTAGSTVNNALTIRAGAFADSALQIVGTAATTVNISGGTTLQIGAGGATTTQFPTLVTNGNITIAATATVIYNSSSSYTLNAAPQHYGNLIISGPGTRTLSAADTINGNLTINSGILNDGGFQLVGNGTGTLIVAASPATLQIGNASASITALPVFGTYALNTSSTVNYSTITSPQLVAAVTYGNLTVTGATGFKYAASVFTVADNLTIATAGGVFADTGNVITINGSVANNGGTHRSSGSGELKFASGSGAHSITTTGASLTATFGNLEFADASQATTISNAATTSGTTNVTGSFIITAGTVNIGTFTTAFNQNSAAITVTIPASCTLNINSATGTKTIAGAVTNTGNLTISAAPSSISFSNTGNTLINTGTVTFSAAPTTMTFSGNVTNNGIWTASGVAPAITIAGNFTNNSGASFTSGTGAYTFSGANKVIGGTITSSSVSPFIFQGAVAVNGSDTLELQYVKINGVLSGAGPLVLFTNDTLNMAASSVNTITNLNCTLNAPTTVAYSTAGSTMKSIATTYYNLYITAAGTVSQSSAGTSTINNSLTIASGSTLADGALQVSGPGTGAGTFTILGTGAFTMTNTATATTAGAVGCFPLFQTYSYSVGSTVSWNANAAQSIPITPVYGGLTIGGGSTKTAVSGGNLTVAGVLTISAGTFADNGDTIKVAGNLALTSATSHTSSGAGEIILNGTTPQNITSTGTFTFGNLEIANSSGTTPQVSGIL